MTAFTGRREFVTLLGGAAASSAAYAQEVDKSRKIGIVFPRPAAAATDNIAGLKSGLQERGYIEGQNLIAEWHFSTGSRPRTRCCPNSERSVLI